MSALRELLVGAAADLDAFVRARGGWLLRYDPPDDLVQGITLRALERGDGYEHRGREPFFGWLYAVARSYLADRRAYWQALRRRPARLVRMTRATPVGSAVGQPAAGDASPSSVGAMREELVKAVRALGALLPRDRDVVTWTSEGCTSEELAERLGVTTVAARQAKRRALERFRRAFALIP